MTSTATPITPTPGRAAGAARLFLAEVDPAHDPLYEAQLGLLDAQERARLERLRLPEVRREALVARLLVRHALSACVPRAPQDWRYARGPYGAPRALDAGGWGFSLSHCAGRVGCLVAPGGRAGLDLERRGSDTSELWQGPSLDPREREALLALPQAQRGDAFLRHWTLKEACAKAGGRGLRLPLRRLAFAFDGEGGTPRWLGERAAAPAWRFWSFRLDVDYVGAIALRRRRVAADTVAVERVAALPYAGVDLGRVLRVGEATATATATANPP
ncbi:4'-phosphopantetheinyl transferase family protein [Lysobacter silvisoli]|uniref:4'-phosphopantetheinyl transferase domain-containing protein n=1 Tax=Lysobacter silvisoli TaxID=2293254 RepID=A0A371JZK5_9GAMM|nr:4'-phosphopantetheinyl transferase superfamily protein [Lysobacter silvisoli]RDZ27105.1 hypothetical protein DX914_12650 [Lysobacter silvisoli]